MSRVGRTLVATTRMDLAPMLLRLTPAGRPWMRGRRVLRQTQPRRKTIMDPVHDKKTEQNQEEERRKKTEGKETEHGRTVANRPADPNRLASKGNFPPGVDADEVRDPGSMDNELERPEDEK